MTNIVFVWLRLNQIITRNRETSTASGGNRGTTGALPVTGGGRLRTGPTSATRREREDLSPTRRPTEGRRVAGKGEWTATQKGERGWYSHVRGTLTVRVPGRPPDTIKSLLAHLITYLHTVGFPTSKGPPVCRERIGELDTVSAETSICCLLPCSRHPSRGSGPQGRRSTPLEDTGPSVSEGWRGSSFPVAQYLVYSPSW